MSDSMRRIGFNAGESDFADAWVTVNSFMPAGSRWMAMGILPIRLFGGSTIPGGCRSDSWYQGS